MSQNNQGNFKKEIFSFKKTANGGTQMKLGKGVKITVDGKEVDAGESGNLFLTKIEEKKNFLNGLVEDGKTTEEKVAKQIAYLDQKIEWGFSSIVEAKVK